jgi:hypothetical protein
MQPFQYQYQCRRVHPHILSSTHDMIRRRISIPFPSSLLYTLPSAQVPTIFTPFLLQNISQCLSFTSPPLSLVFPWAPLPEPSSWWPGRCRIPKADMELLRRHSREMCPSVRVQRVERQSGSRRWNPRHVRWGRTWWINQKLCSSCYAAALANALQPTDAVQSHGFIATGLPWRFVVWSGRVRTTRSLSAVNCFHKQGSNDRVTAGIFTGDRDCS